MRSIKPFRIGYYNRNSDFMLILVSLITCGQECFSPLPVGIMESIDRLIGEALEYFGIVADFEVSTRLVSYVEELEKWNRRMNLTGLARGESIVRDLISDGLFLQTVIPARGIIADLGSGAGVLAVPLAILDRSRTVLSIDKNLKKAQFQRHLKRLLRLANLDVLHGRAQDFAPLMADTLLAKAFGTVSQILKLGGPHVKDGGFAFLVRGAREAAAEEKGFVLRDMRLYHLPGSAKAYQLFVYKKVT
jgi:16S rRNA (guanine527-N7)-methyltransferase